MFQKQYSLGKVSLNLFLDDPEESQSKTNKATPEREGAWKSTKEIKEYFNNAEKKTAHGLLRSELKKKKKERKKVKARQWWLTPLIPTLGRQRQADFWVQGQPGLQSSRTARATQRNPVWKKTKQTNKQTKPNINQKFNF